MSVGRRTRRAFLREVAWIGAATVGLSLSAACTPLPLEPRPNRVYRVGLLRPPSGDTGGGRFFWQRLDELGYVEGVSLVKLERAGAETAWPALAEELANLQADVIAANSSAAARAAMAAAPSTPIVMIQATEPIEAGLVQSFPRPGGNVTGLTGEPPEVEQKRLQLLVEAAPAASRVAVVGAGPRFDPTDGPWVEAARLLGVSVVGMGENLSTAEYEPAFERAVADGVNGLLVRGGTVADAALIVRLAERYRLPAIYRSRTHVGLGGLMCYLALVAAANRRAAEFVDRILRGARPADLPIELPSRYEMLVNRRTAQALGLTLSPEFMAHVDEVIE